MRRFFKKVLEIIGANKRTLEPKTRLAEKQANPYEKIINQDFEKVGGGIDWYSKEFEQDVSKLQDAHSVLTKLVNVNVDNLRIHEIMVLISKVEEGLFAAAHRAPTEKKGLSTYRRNIESFAKGIEYLTKLLENKTKEGFTVPLQYRQLPEIMKKVINDPEAFAKYVQTISHHKREKYETIWSDISSLKNMFEKEPLNEKNFSQAKVISKKILEDIKFFGDSVFPAGVPPGMETDLMILAKAKNIEDVKKEIGESNWRTSEIIKI